MRLLAIHHIDYVVRDLDRAIGQYERLFDIKMQQRERLESRGVELARFQLGLIWLVLVQPVNDNSPVKRFLDEHGEGFYHIAYQVEDVQQAASELKAKGVELMNEKPRLGVEGWKLVDLQMHETFGLMTQLVEP